MIIYASLSLSGKTLIDYLKKQTYKDDQDYSGERLNEMRNPSGMKGTFSMDAIELNHHVQMPLLGMGVFQVTDYGLCKRSILTALNIGYRLIDTAACYEKEGAEGEAVKECGISRKEVFLTFKMKIQDAGYDKTMRSFEKTLKNLQRDYLNLYLIHMPYRDCYGSWRAMEELYQAGKIKTIGV